MSRSTPLPIVAIVGRPNVGKSTLFNRYAGSRRALVEGTPGITRDRIVEEVDVEGRSVLVVDTAGLDPDAEAGLPAAIQAQARAALADADAIVFVVDGRAGLLPEDEELARELRRTAKPLAVAVNKIDTPAHEPLTAEFHRLGLPRVRPISAQHGRGAWDLLEELVEHLPPLPPGEGIEPELEAEGGGPPEAQPRCFSEAKEGEAPEALKQGPAAAQERARLERLGKRKGAEPERVGEASAAELEEAEQAGTAARPIRVAVVGRPNVGKSSLVNRLLGGERVVVSEEPGTTRDAVDTRLETGEGAFVLVDTAGLRRPGRRAAVAERGSALMAVRSIERADVALVLIDAAEGFTDQDAHVAGLVRQRGRPAALLANKWDRVGPEERPKVREEIRRRLRFMGDTPVLSVSARTGASLDKILPLVKRLFSASRRRLSTAELNRWLQDSTARHEPAMGQRGTRKRPIRFFYATQTGVAPPTFVLFCTDPASIRPAYRRFLENRLRDRFDLTGTPIRLRLRPRPRQRRGRA